MKPWSGRFSKETDKLVEEYTAAEDITLDKKLIIYDIIGTEVHNIMLNRVGILETATLNKILSTLDELKNLWEAGKFALKIDYEDVHMNVEKFVIDKIGEETGGMMHLARSRNDQVLLDLRLYIRDEICEIFDLILELINVFMEKVEKNSETVMPAYTHFQPAQPITFAFWCMAHVDAFIRDLTRLNEIFKRINTNPLGAGAIAGVSWSIDRSITMDLLNFDGIQENALDVISSRGEFTSELLAIFSIIMTHLGKISTDLILWSSKEFNLIELDDAFTTGSSIMPQKKNPDAAELVRAKANKIIGYLSQNLGILQGLPSGYNRDFQETKGPLMYSIDIIKGSVKIVSGMIKTVKINKDRMLSLANSNFITATELIDLLMKKGNISFRTAHKIVGKLVGVLISKDLDLNNLKATMIEETIKNSINKEIEITDDDIQKAINPWKTVQRREHIGGPSKKEVLRMYKDRKNIIKEITEKNLDRKNNIKKSYESLEKLVQTLISNKKTKE